MDSSLVSSRVCQSCGRKIFDAAELFHFICSGIERNVEVPFSSTPHKKKIRKQRLNAFCLHPYPRRTEVLNRERVFFAIVYHPLPWEIWERSCEGSSTMIDICIALDQSVSPTLVCGLFKIPGFSGRRYFKRLVPTPFFGSRIRRQNFNRTIPPAAQAIRP